MTGTRPAKPWRVYQSGQRLMATDHRYRPGAYEAVATIARRGGTAKVYHWSDGSWRLYEVIEAPAAEAQA